MRTWRANTTEQGENRQKLGLFPASISVFASDWLERRLGLEEIRSDSVPVQVATEPCAEARSIPTSAPR